MKRAVLDCGSTSHGKTSIQVKKNESINEYTEKSFKTFI